MCVCVFLQALWESKSHLNSIAILVGIRKNMSGGKMRYYVSRSPVVDLFICPISHCNSATGFEKVLPSISNVKSYFQFFRLNHIQTTLSSNSPTDFFRKISLSENSDQCLKIHQIHSHRSKHDGNTGQPKKSLPAL